jgi:hypothetical protein
MNIVIFLPPVALYVKSKLLSVLPVPNNVPVTIYKSVILREFLGSLRTVVRPAATLLPKAVTLLVLLLRQSATINASKPKDVSLQVMAIMVAKKFPHLPTQLVMFDVVAAISKPTTVQSGMPNFAPTAAKTTPAKYYWKTVKPVFWPPLVNRVNAIFPMGKTVFVLQVR